MWLKNNSDVGGAAHWILVRYAKTSKRYRRLIGDRSLKQFREPKYDLGIKHAQSIEQLPVAVEVLEHQFPKLQQLNNVRAGFEDLH